MVFALATGPKHRGFEIIASLILSSITNILISGVPGYCGVTARYVADQLAKTFGENHDYSLFQIYLYTYDLVSDYLSTTKG